MRARLLASACGKMAVQKELATTCYPAIGKCEMTVVNTGQARDDGSQCTVGDCCKSGTCAAGNKEPAGHLALYSEATAGTEFVATKNKSAMWTWYHLAATRSGTSVKLHLNGNVDMQGKPNWTPPATEVLRIGGHQDLVPKVHTQSHAVEGLIDEVRLSTRALAADELMRYPPLQVQ